MIISIDWSFKKPLALFDGEKHTELPITRNETVKEIITLYGSDITIITENMPHDLKRNFLENDINVFIVHPNAVKDFKNRNQIENPDDDAVSAWCIYTLYQNNPEYFRQVIIDPRQETLRNVVKSFKDIQKVRIKIDQRNNIKSKFIDNIETSTVNLEKEENVIKKQMSKLLDSFPVYNNFLVHVRGVGPIIAAQLIAHIDIRAAHKSSAMIKYCGLGVNDGKADCRVAGQHIQYNPELKTICLGHLGESLIKTNDAKYRQIYDNTKLKYIERYGEMATTSAKAGTRKREGEWNKMRVHLTARRVMVKQFLSDLWSQWRKAEGLSVSYPYPIAVLGHKTYITDDPINFVTIQINSDVLRETIIKPEIMPIKIDLVPIKRSRQITF